jgi:hypothetical protein
MRAVWRRIGEFTGHVYQDDATLALVTTPQTTVKSAWSYSRAG